MNIYSSTRMPHTYLGSASRFTPLSDRGHGLLNVRKIGEEKLSVKPPMEVYENIIEFLQELLSTPQTKNEFYTRIMGSIGTKYNGARGGFRIDVQSPKADAQNIQIQWESTTIATVLVSQTLFLFDRNTPHCNSMQRSFAKYILRQMIGAVNASLEKRIAVVLAVNEKTRLASLIPQ